MSSSCVLIADPHPMIAESLALSIDQHSGFTTYPCSQYCEVPDLVTTLQPRIIVIAIYPQICDEGLEICRMAANIPGNHLLTLIASDELVEDDNFTLNAVEAGADGLLVREQVNLRELVTALEHIDEGYTVFDTRKLRAALATRRTIPPLPNDLPLCEQLTGRERTIADHISLGKSTRDIAEELTISERTVQTHISNILAKIGVQTRAEAAVYLYHLRTSDEASQQRDSNDTLKPTN